MLARVMRVDFDWQSAMRRVVHRTAECAQLTGNMLENEKILGTVHVAFGASAGA